MQSLLYLHAPQILFIISRENINARLSHRFHNETNTNSQVIYKTSLIIVRLDIAIVNWAQHISRIGSSLSSSAAFYLKKQF